MRRARVWPLLLGLFGAAAAAGETYVTAGGVALRTPPIAEIGCAEMEAVLDAIDASGYRGGAPRPKDDADMALLSYEDRLSRAFYARCVAEGGLADGTFGAGFRADPAR